MTSPFLLSDLRRDEGDELRAYPDPLTHGPPWTIGEGHAGPDVHEGETITEADSHALVTHDVALVEAGLDRKLPWWRGLSDLRQDVLVNMTFNMGLTRFLMFGTFLAFAKAALYQRAALDMLGTEWARELPARAGRLSRQMATGEHQS